ncbi:unnamed protein product [Umbelopsis sp. WA50703]
MQVEDYLAEQCSETEMEAKWKGDDRSPLNAAHRWTKLSNGKPACAEHKQIGCEECFNWGEGLLREIKGEKKIRKAAKKSKKDTL